MVERIGSYLGTSFPLFQGPRLVPASSGGAVVMKLDVEGREMSIIGNTTT